MSKITQEDVQKPIEATCGKCGCKHAIIHYEPAPKGTFICPRCSLGIDHKEIE